MSLSEKIVRWEDLPQWRSRLRASGRRLVVTNGCFDLLHAGHVTYLERARGLGDVLLIGLNGDASVRELKGPGRPVNTEQDRATVLAALESVTGVCIFSERSANPFLAIAEPDIYVKGGDYTIDTIPRTNVARWKRPVAEFISWALCRANPPPLCSRASAGASRYCGMICDGHDGTVPAAGWVAVPETPGVVVGDGSGGSAVLC